MSLASDLAAHGIHFFTDRADYIAYVPDNGPAPTADTENVICVQGEFKGKHKVRLYNLDQAFNGAKFDARDYPSTEALAADLVQAILSACYYGLPEDLRREYDRTRR